MPPERIANGRHDILKDLHPAVEAASRRTEMSFQRTRVAAERTLMSVIRTSLSLISFGFVIFQFFRYLREATATSAHVPVAAAHIFGFSLVFLGVVTLIVGIWYYAKFMQGLGDSVRYWLSRD